MFVKHNSTMHCVYKCMYYYTKQHSIHITLHISFHAHCHMYPHSSPTKAGSMVTNSLEVNRLVLMEGEVHVNRGNTVCPCTVLYVVSTANELPSGWVTSVLLLEWNSSTNHPIWTILLDKSRLSDEVQCYFRKFSMGEKHDFEKVEGVIA